MGIKIFPRDKEVNIYVESKGGDKNRAKLLNQKEKIYGEIIGELNEEYHKSVLKINQCIRNLVKDNEGDNILLLSEQEGGFACTGIEVEDNRGRTKEYPNLNYVNLSLDSESIKLGEMMIYSHELGHVMMKNIIKNYPEGKSTKQHVSMGITDYFTAFSEGWAIHFERLAYENVEKYRDVYFKDDSLENSILNLWQCRYDSKMRIDMVKENGYIFEKIIPESDFSDGSLRSRILEEHVSHVYNKLKLKNINQMLSSEGVIATIFYRITTNEVIQNNYLDKRFYQQFSLEPISQEEKIQEIFTPMENSLLKSAYMFYSMRGELHEKSIPMIDFIKNWCEIFPKDKNEIIELFIYLTIGESVNEDLRYIYEKNAYCGMMGDLKLFKSGLVEYRKKHKEIHELVMGNVENLYNNVHEEEWAEISDIKVPKCFWCEQGEQHLRVNKFAATEIELEGF